MAEYCAQVSRLFVQFLCWSQDGDLAHKSKAKKKIFF